MLIRKVNNLSQVFSKFFYQRKLYSSRTDELINKANQYLLGVYSRPDLIFERGKGAFLYDTNGRRFIDFTAGIAVAGLGHGDSQLQEAISDQAKKLVITSNLFHNEHAGNLAELLVKSTSFMENSKPWASKVFFTNSGAEANEAALKFFRKSGLLKSPKKSKIVCFEGAFHGRTMGALSVTPKKAYQEPFLPLIPNITTATFNSIDKIEQIITDEVCGVIVEPIQGEGGIRQCSLEFLKKLREQCTKVNALLCYDEIQCGIARTGKLWAHQHYQESLSPDMMCIAKPLGNGLPIGAILVTQAVADTLKVGDHGTTFGGNPLCLRGALSVFPRLCSEELQNHVSNMGVIVKQYIKNLNHHAIEEIRGLGLILGVKFKKEVEPSEICKKARDKGLLIITASDNTIRLVPPLIITEKELREGLEIFKDCLP